MSQAERYIIIISLINAAIFYAITLIVYLMVRKTSLNKALATQKGIWFLLIVLIALPAYVHSIPNPPSWLRTFCWAMLSVATWWVLYEVYDANWRGNWRGFLTVVRYNFAHAPERLWNWLGKGH